MATLHSLHTFTQRRSGGRDEPEDLRQLRREHQSSLATLKELFAEWTEEDLLYALQDAGGEVETTIIRISEGHATQWGEVKGKKKTPKPKSASEQQQFRSSSQRGGFTGRGRGDGTRGGRGGSTRGGARAQNGDRPARASKSESETAAIAEPTPSDAGAVEKTDVKETPSWASITAGSLNTANAANAANVANASIVANAANAANTVSTSTDVSVSSSANVEITSSESSAIQAQTIISEDASVSISNESSTISATTVTTTTSTTSVTSTTSSARKVNTSTIPAGTKMSWAKIVKPAPAPAPTPAPASAPAPAAAASVSASIPAEEPVSAATTEDEVVENTPEPVAESTPEPTPAAVPAVEEPVAEESVAEPTPAEPIVEEEEEVEEPAVPAPEPVAAEPEPVKDAALSPKVATAGPPGLKPKVTQPRRVNQEAPVVLPTGSASLQSVAVKFGNFSLGEDTEAAVPEPQQPEQVQVEQPAQQPAAPVAAPAAAAAAAPAPAAATTPAAVPAAAPSPAAAAAQPAQPAAQPQQAQPQPHAQAAYGRQAGAAGYQGAAPAATGLSPAAANASYMKQDPAAVNYLGQHHHHPGMGHDAMGSPYGSYMPNPASQLGSFGMGPIASLPNDYAALYGNELQRAMYYDPASYGQIPVTAANNYQSRDGKYNQDASSAVSTSGAANTSSTQAQQTLQQQQQQQQQAYPGMAGGIPYYPYYYMPNQFPNAYQQSGYGQPFVNKNMYPMYHNQGQQHSNKPGAGSNSPYGSYNTTGAQGHHQYSQSGYDDMSGAGIHGMGGLNDHYGKYGNPGMQNYLGNQQQPSTPNANANPGKGNATSANYAGSDKNTGAGSQSGNASQMAGGASLQGQQPGNNANQGGQQGYYQQQMFSSYQYPTHHQGYHPNQHQGQHQGSGRNQQQFWAQN